LQAQGQGQRLQKLDAYKVGFFTKRLNLTAREAEVFWPVYNEYQERRNKILLDRREIIRVFNQTGQNLSDKELTGLGDRLIEGMTRESALSVDLHKKLREILPPQKVLRFYQAENQYKAQLLDELQQGARQRLQPGNQEFDPDL
jgi:hypothetical protein